LQFRHINHYRSLTFHDQNERMKTDTIKFAVRLIAIAIATSGLGGCALFSSVHLARVTDERECLARAMYFESNRSSEDGMLAVGTVVMNRKESGKYPSSICGVVGQPVQFAPGVLSRSMNDAGRPRALRVADEVLAGKRYPGMKGVYFFHTAGYTYPYSNMHYVAVAGGNAFYEKRRSPGAVPTEAPVMVAQADPMPAPRPRARPAVQLAEYQPDLAPSEANAAPLPPVRSLAKAPRPQIAQYDPDTAPEPVPDALPPERPRASIGQAHPAAPLRVRPAKTQVAYDQDAVPLPPQDDMPPVRPRAAKQPARSAAEVPVPPVPQFRFQQGPSGKAVAPRPRTVVAQAQNTRSVPTLRVRTAPVEADMGGLPPRAPEGLPPVKKPIKPRSALEPEPLY
jgi:spore germination cell wall hydrolase CwlJ-like protein